MRLRRNPQNNHNGMVSQTQGGERGGRGGGREGGRGGGGGGGGEGERERWKKGGEKERERERERCGGREIRRDGGGEKRWRDGERERMREDWNNPIVAIFKDMAFLMIILIPARPLIGRGICLSPCHTQSLIKTQSQATNPNKPLQPPVREEREQRLQEAVRLARGQECAL